MAPGALNGAPANKTLNKKMTIWGPSPAGAASGAPANRILNKKITISGPARPAALLVLLVISFLIRK